MLEVDQKLIIPSKPSVRITVERIKPNGFIELLDESSGGIIAMHPGDIEKKLRIGKITVAADVIQGNYTIDPSYLADPAEPGLSLTEREARKRRSRLFNQARALQFFTSRHDQMPDVGKTEAALSRFIRRHKEEARERGITWIPSSSSLRRALRRYGSVGDRPLVVFLRRHSKLPGGRWCSVVRDLGRRMCRYYWSSSKPIRWQALLYFHAVLDRYKRKCVAHNKPSEFDCPGDATLVGWIAGFADKDRYALRFGLRSAKRKFSGRMAADEPTRALETLMIDDTPLDVHAVLLDENGNELYRGRPHLTLIMDVYSRMTLAAVISFEPPSTSTAMMALRQSMTPKTELIAEFGPLGGATDCYGSGTTIVTDNAKAYNEMSFHAACESIGLNFEAGASAIAEHKTFIEGFFGTLNTGLWHSFKEGVRYPTHIMRQLKERPAEHAFRTVDELERLLWRYIVLMHHSRRHPSLKASPAQVWRSSLEKNGRRTLADPSILDAFGTSNRCNLTPYGVRLNGQQFHDPAITSRLLDALVRTTTLGDPRKSPYRSSVIPIFAVSDPADCSAIRVWDATSRQYVRLPNIDNRLQTPVPWSVVGSWLETFEDPEIGKSEIVRHKDRLRNQIAPRKRKIAVNIRKVLDAKKKGPVAFKTGSVTEETAPPSVSGMQPPELAIGTAAQLRSDARIPHKSQPRRKTSRSKRKPVEASGASTLGAPEYEDLRVSLRPLVDDPASLLSELKEQMKDEWQ